jgi:hypothetical protein
MDAPRGGRHFDFSFSGLQTRRGHGLSHPEGKFSTVATRAGCHAGSDFDGNDSAASRIATT